MQFKKYRHVLILMIMLITLLEAQAKVVAAISSLKGAVLVKEGGSRKYIPAYKGQMLKNGDWLKTKDGVFIAIIFLDGSNIKIQQKTEIKIASYRLTAKELKTTVEMSKGQAWSDVADQGTGEFTISTPTAVASVKGTELDIEFDIGNEETNLIVVEGEVELSNEFGSILAGAMTSSTVAVGEEPSEPVVITSEDIPTWQTKTDPEWTFKLKPDKVGKQPVGEIIKISVQILNAKEKTFDDSFSGDASVESQIDALLVSADGGSWSSTSTIKITNGRGLVHAKAGKEGIFEFIINSDGAESESFKVEYYQSKSQKQGMIEKIVAALTKLGKEDIIAVLEGKSLQSSNVIGNTANSVEELLQKIDNGELVLMGNIEFADNGDGTYSMKMKVQPKK